MADKETIDIKSFLDEEGRIKTWPKKMRMKKELLRYLSTKFEVNRDYSEGEVNRTIKEWQTIDDFFLLRRGLIEFGFMGREGDGSRYWKNPGEPRVRPEDVASCSLAAFPAVLETEVEE